MDCKWLLVIECFLAELAVVNNCIFCDTIQPCSPCCTGFRRASWLTEPNPGRGCGLVERAMPHNSTMGPSERKLRRLMTFI
eukprot:679427-Pyramimonas_sp.AAC.1